MLASRRRFRSRRGGATTITLVGMTATLITAGALMDTGKITVARHRDQVIADGAAMAAAVYLPDEARARAAADRVVAYYRGAYHKYFTYQFAFQKNKDSLPVSVTADINEQVAMVFPALMGASTRPTKARAAAGRMVPSAMLAGVVPLGVQYDLDFDLPPNGTASPNTIQLKFGNGDEKPLPGNMYALSFDDGPGASMWSENLKWGYEGVLKVGQIIQTKPGNMAGPTEAALITDTDSRLNRAMGYPYNDDTWQGFDPGNPRVVVVPLVDWMSAKGGRSDLEIKGFAAFFVNDYDKKGAIFGRFVRYTVSKTGGPGWDGISIDPESSGSFDGGLWGATMLE